MLAAVGPAAAQVDEYIGQPITIVRVYESDRLVTAGQVVDLVETRVGFPLTLDRVRESILQLYALGRYDQVRVEAEHDELGVAVTYRLQRVRVAARVTFEGATRLDDDLLRDTVASPLGRPPRLANARQAEAALRTLYARHGYDQASVTSAPVPTGPAGDLALEFRIEAGDRRLIDHVVVEGTVPFGEARLLSLLKIARGGRWNPADVDARLERALGEFRDRGHYEAGLRATAASAARGPGVVVTVAVDAGPRTTLVFEGDPLPRARLDSLVPLEREGAADEDLLEDSKRRIEHHLQASGYWRAHVDYRREPIDPGAQRIVFSVAQGRRAVTGSAAVSGNTAVSAPDALAMLTLDPGEPFVQATLDADLARLARLYQERGYATARLDAVLATREPAAAADPVVVDPRIRVQEGPRTMVRDVTFTGVTAVDDATLRAGLQAAPGTAFYAPRVVQDRSAIARALISRGYLNARVDVKPDFSADQGHVDLHYTVDEGPRILVDRVIIVGNRRTSTRTISRELQVESGAPLNPDALTESQRRLAALGLFRRVRVEDISTPGESSRDVVVTVEEAPPTSIGYGAGLEVGRRLRQEDDGTAVERIEFAPRGFFEIGRRNLFGKNRSLNLFLRGSLRERDPTGEVSNRVGLNEYRVLTVFREPRLFGTGADAEVSAFAEQAVRSSFNFSRNGVTAQVAKRLSRQWNMVGRYTLGSTKIFDARYNPAEQPLIDRLFPQVRLSVVSLASFWDTRDDVLDPTRGVLLGLETDLALPGLGSEVGHVKNLVQGFAYRRVPGTSRLIVAAGARLGLATGFERIVSQPDPDNPGETIEEVVKDLPASERFYAGGDTTVRGYALDRLGDGPTIDSNGFPTGGNGLIILNGELRFPVWRSVGGVAFVDAGNVFLNASDIDLTRIRSVVGFGLRYKSPVGPIRFDVGFKLNPQTFADGTRERGYALHISIGQAF